MMVRQVFWRAVSATALCMACAVGIAFAAAVPAASVSAWADEATGENRVNPQQLPDSSFIYDTLISDLAQADSYFDGQTVQVTGEVVGDSIHASLDGSYRWITLQATDGSYAQVAVFMTEEFAASIDTYGAYGKTGTTLQARGTFNLACDEHEGLTDLHANHVSVVKKGSVARPDLDMNAFIPGFTLVVLGGLLVFVFYRMREKLR